MGAVTLPRLLKCLFLWLNKENIFLKVKLWNVSDSNPWRIYGMEPGQMQKGEGVSRCSDAIWVGASSTMKSWLKEMIPNPDVKTYPRINTRTHFPFQSNPHSSEKERESW